MEKFTVVFDGDKISILMEKGMLKVSPVRIQNSFKQVLRRWKELRAQIILEDRRASEALKKQESKAVLTS